MSERIIMSKVSDSIYLMDDAHEATGFIVVGKERAMVIDTMIGYDNVYDIVRRVTDLPLTVFNTHGHCDHIWGNVYFDEAYLSPLDLDVAKEHMAFPEFVSRSSERGLKMPPFRPVEEGAVFDLGGITLEAFGLPGHTKGSMALFHKEERTLFTGDAINHHIWLQLEESLPLSEYLDVLNKRADLIFRADKMLHSHARGYDDISLVDKVRRGLEELTGENGDEICLADEAYHWFGGIDKQHIFDTDGSVICYKADRR